MVQEWTEFIPIGCNMLVIFERKTYITLWLLRELNMNMINFILNPIKRGRLFHFKVLDVFADPSSEN